MPGNTFHIPPIFVPAFEDVHARYLMPITRLSVLPGGWARHARKAGHFLNIATETLDQKWGTIVPRKNGQPDFQIEAWVNVSLSDADKEEISRVGVDWQAIFDWFGRRVYEGYRITLSWDEYSKAVQAAIICRNPDLGDYGLAMSSRHPDADLALMSLIYKDTIIGVDGWRALLDQAPVTRNWD